MPGREIIVVGRVQGVGFRWFVQDCANRNGINGYVKNLPDGTVQIIAVGSSAALEQFTRDVKHGNRHAQIEQFIVSELTHYTEYEDFIIA